MTFNIGSQSGGVINNVAGDQHITGPQYGTLVTTGDARRALGDLRQDAVERAAAGLGGERTFAGVVDVRDETSVQAFFAAAERALGPVTIAVANAGIYPNCPVLDMTSKLWRRFFRLFKTYSM